MYRFMNFLFIYLYVCISKVHFFLLNLKLVGVMILKDIYVESICLFLLNRMRMISPFS